MADCEHIYYDSTLTGPELDEGLKTFPQAVLDARAAAKAAESWSDGGTGTRQGEDTDNAKYWAGQARAGESAAAETEKRVNALQEAAAASAAAAQTSAQSADQAAAQAAQSAQAAAGSAGEAAASAQTAREYSGKPPVIQNGTWWIWNAEKQQYQDTGLQALLVDVNSGANVQMWFGTVAEYNALTEIDPHIYYNILEGEP